MSMGKIITEKVYLITWIDFGEYRKEKFYSEKEAEKRCDELFDEGYAVKCEIIKEYDFM